MVVPSRNQGRPGPNFIARFRFPYFHLTELVEILGERFGEILGHMLNGDDSGQVGGKLTENFLEDLGGARRAADGDDIYRAGRG